MTKIKKGGREIELKMVIEEAMKSGTCGIVPRGK